MHPWTTLVITFCSKNITFTGKGSKKQHVERPGDRPKIMEGAAQQQRTNQGASH